MRWPATILILGDYLPMSLFSLILLSVMNYACMCNTISCIFIRLVKTLSVPIIVSLQCDKVVIFFYLQKQQKFTENKLKTLKARNEYLLCIDVANAAIKKYYSEDIQDVIDVSASHITFTDLCLSALCRLCSY